MDASFNSPLDLQQIFNTAPGLLLVLALDSPRFTILAATDAYLHATMRQRSEIIGRGLFDVFPDNRADPGSRATQIFRASLARAIDTRVPDLMAQQRYDIRRSQAAGGGFEERYWLQRNSPVIGACGQLTYLIHSVEDVTASVLARRQAAAQPIRQTRFRHDDALRDIQIDLRESRAGTGRPAQDAVAFQQHRIDPGSAERPSTEQQLRVATDTAQVGMWTWQPDGDRVSWDNDWPYEIFGIPRTEAPLTAARFAADFVYPEDLAGFNQAIANTVQNGARLFYQGRIQRPDGDMRWIEFIGQPGPHKLHGCEEPSLRVVGTVQDITGHKQAEQLLRQNHDTFFNLIQNAPFGLYVVDAQFRLSQVSTASRKVFSHIDPLIGRDFEEVLRLIWTDPFATAAIGHFRHTLETGEPYCAPNTTEQRQNIPEIESYDWKIERITMPDGQFGVVCYFYDITERMQAQSALRESEARYRNLFNSMDEGFCIIDMLFDENEKPVDYRFLEVNPAFENQTGMRDVTGKRVREIIPDLEEYWFEIYGAVALTGKPARFVNEVKMLDRLLEIHAVRLGGPQTRQVAVLFDNITERMKADEALRQSEARFRVLFDTGPIAIYSCDASGLIVEFNACAVTLWGREPRRGDSDERYSFASRMFLPDGTLLPPEKSSMADVLNGKIAAAYDNEFIIERPDGSRITVMSNVVALRNEQGQISGGMCCFYDITERSRLERISLEQTQALSDLDRRKDEFLAMLSHELRNPLAALSNAAHLLRLQKSEEPAQHQARSIIERQVGQLTNLVDDLLEVSRISTGRVQLRRDLVAVSGIVERAVETAQPLLTLHRHQFTVSMPSVPIWLLADAARLEQVLVNLLTNAAKYTEDGGHIWLSVEQDVANPVPMVVIKVRDSGVGIEPDLLPHIFDLFTQADRSLHRSQGGLGIGLSLVQRLVGLHGGTVTASSVPGQGSVFEVRLPPGVRTAADLPVSASAALTASLGSSAPSAGSGCRVLLVDDNTDAVQSLAVLLEMSGYAVHLAYDGLGAIEAAIEHQPDVVLLDIGLPGLDGYQVAQRIRQQAQLKGVVLIALTGYGRETDRERSRLVGFDHHLIKPASIEQIEAILRGVAAAR